jgi:hypothetical protein
MIDVIKKIKRMNVKEIEENAQVFPLKKFIYFNFEKKKLEKTETNLKFIEQLKENCETEMKEFGTFGRFFFDLNGAYLELYIAIEENSILIDPYLVYTEGINKNIQKILYREFYIYCLFKKNELQ